MHLTLKHTLSMVPLSLQSLRNLVFQLKYKEENYYLLETRMGPHFGYDHLERMNVFLEVVIDKWFQQDKPKKKEEY